MKRVYLSFLGFSLLTACGGAHGTTAFPTGVFQMTFQQASSNCSFSLQTDPQTVTIDVDDYGTYYLTAFGGEVPASSESAEHVTFLLAPTTATPSDQCTYDETDTLTLTAAGDNFNGTALQSFTGGTCAACSITQALAGTKTSN